MKKPCLILLFLLLCYNAFAQDRIVKTNGDEVPARILEITLHEILYLHPDSLQGETRRLPKTEVFLVQFANGGKEVFEQHLPDASAGSLAGLSPEQKRLLGREDAVKYYNGQGAMWGAAASTFTLFPIGFVGSIVIAATPPKVENFRVSDIRLLQEPAYVEAYRRQAHRQKRGKVLAGVGIGVGIQLAAILVLVASQ